MQQILAIDIGNSNIVIGLFSGNKLLNKWRLSSNKSATSDEYSAIIGSLLASESSYSPKISVICSVVPSLIPVIISSLQSIGIKNNQTIDSSSKLNMPILIDNPKQLGADRIVNGYYAFQIYKKGLVVIDFGTATTFDVVNNEGQFLGGVIACGISIGLQSLVKNTAQLPNIELIAPKKTIGTNTILSMQSGALFGHAAMCEGIVQRIKLELGFQPIIIATGGLANIMHNLVKDFDHIDEDLTIKGLLKIYNDLKNN